MTAFKNATILFAILALIAGCKPTATPTGTAPDDTGNSETVTTPEVPADPDDAASVSALEESGAKLKKDGDGFVIEVDFRGTSVGDSALEPLATKPRLPNRS